MLKWGREYLMYSECYSQCYFHHGLLKQSENIDVTLHIPNVSLLVIMFHPHILLVTYENPNAWWVEKWWRKFCVCMHQLSISTWIIRLCLNQPLLATISDLFEAEWNCLFWKNIEQFSKIQWKPSWFHNLWNSQTVMKSTRLYID